MGELTHERLREVIRYDSEAGMLVWLKTLSNRGAAGKIAGTMRPDGRLQVRIDGVIYMTSRLIWFWIHGHWPKGEIDHINCDPSDNRLGNLREATPSQNSANTRTRPSQLGIKGIYLDRRDGRYYARVKHRRKRISLGGYATAEEAAAAYAAGAARIFGEFARTA